MMVSIIKIVLYTKPTAEHQYFLRSSCHPLHTFPFSLALRIQSVCSFNQTFKLRCNELTQAQYLNRRGYNLGLLKQEIQRVHTFTKTHTRNSPTRIPLVVGYHPPIPLNIIYFSPKGNTFTISRPPNFVPLCLYMYLSLPSCVLTSRKSAKWTSRSEPELSINVMVLYTVQSPLFSRRSSRTSATGGYLDRV